MSRSRFGLLKFLNTDTLAMDLVIFHQRRIYRTFSLTLGFIYSARFVGSLFPPTASSLVLLLSSLFLFGLYAKSKAYEKIKRLSVLIISLIYLSEMSLVLLGATHFTSFLLLIPLSIVFLAVMANMRTAIALSGLATLLSMIFVDNILDWSAVDHWSLVKDVIPHQMLLYLLGAQLLIILVIFLFEDMLRNSRIENQSRRLNEARIAQKSAVAETLGKAVHEFNNPLAILDAALLRLQHSQAQNETAQKRKNLVAMSEASERMEKLLKNVRIFVEGQFDELITRVAVKDIHKIFQTFAEKRMATSGIAFKMLQTYKGYVCCRPKQVEFVLQVYLENAIEATRGELRTITFQSFLHSDCVRFALDDEGRGVSPENSERIFTPFFTTKILGVSTGMNLSLCRVLIREQGGTVGFEKLKEGGTRFYLDLPRPTEKGVS